MFDNSVQFKMENSYTGLGNFGLLGTTMQHKKKELYLEPEILPRNRIAPPYSQATVHIYA